ncbi:50S ribosomal protein L15 [Candidatus Parcubacteria bacterium]|nr:50S ribosomal protein L15 [Candidatus Parcubacteria bacterium]
MKFNDLKLTSHKKPTRKGRGISAGEGKTAGRGTKGQGARKSGGVRPGFEGGQMPLYMRIPKLRGFKSHRPKVENVYTGQLDNLSKTTIDTNTLHEAGLIQSPFVKVKLISKGDVKKKLTVKLQVASAGAVNRLQKAGGTFQKVEQLKRPAKVKKKD